MIRFLTGLGLGGAMPNAVAMTSEFNPHRRRATMVMIMFCGFSVGRRAGRLSRRGADSAIRLALGVRRRWRRAAVAGADPGAAVAGIRALPGADRARATAGRRIARRDQSEGRLRPATQFVVHETRLTGMPVLHLFRDGRTLATLLLWVVFFMSLLDLYFLSNWLPTVLNDLGASVSEAAVIGSMLQVGGIVGTFALGSVIDRFSFRALALVYFVAVFAVGAIGQVGHSAVLVTIAIFAAGFCIVGGQIAANALAAAFYPTSVQGHRRRLGARNRPGRLDRRAAGRRRAADA